MTRRGTILHLLLLGAGAVAALCCSVPPAQARAVTLGHPGYVVITSGLDTSLGYRWELGPAPGQRSLIWADGHLALPDSLELESLRDVDLLVPVTGELGGLGNSGRLVFREGIFPVSEPIHLSDGRIELYLKAGELEIQGQRVRYTAPAAKRSDPKAGYVFLAGMVILVFVLLRRLAVRNKKRHQG